MAENKLDLYLGGTLGAKSGHVFLMLVLKFSATSLIVGSSAYLCAQSPCLIVRQRADTSTVSNKPCAKFYRVLKSRSAGPVGIASPVCYLKHSLAITVGSISQSSCELRTGKLYKGLWPVECSPPNSDIHL